MTNRRGRDPWLDGDERHGRHRRERPDPRYPDGAGYPDGRSGRDPWLDRSERAGWQPRDSWQRSAPHEMWDRYSAYEYGDEQSFPANVDPRQGRDEPGARHYQATRPPPPDYRNGRNGYPAGRRSTEALNMLVRPRPRTGFNGARGGGISPRGATSQVRYREPTRAGRRADSPAPATPRLAGVAWAAVGAGIAIDGLAVTMAWRGSGISVPLFWLAIVAPFLVLVTILVRRRPSPATRQLAVVLLGLYPALTYRMSSPLVLGSFDEHLHERTLSDLLHGSGLFAPNPILPASPRYPGLELFTGVLIRLTGVPEMVGMSLAVFICRVLLVLAIYYGALDVTRSYRRASLMVIFYAASPQFAFFDSLFAYETMALTLAVGGLVMLNRSLQDDYPGARRPLVVIATIALMASVVSHHATSWIAVAFLIGWTASAKRVNRRTLAYVTGLVAAVLLFWTALSINQLEHYIGPIFSGIVGQLLSSIGQVHLFKDAAGTADPAWERATLIIYALLATGAAISSGVVVLRRARRERRYTLAFVAVLSIGFPATLASHFVSSTTYLGDRTSNFLALPVALCCSLAIRNPVGALRRGRRPTRMDFVLTAGVVTLAFLGGVIMSSGPSFNLLPGKYLVVADNHGQDPETLAAVRWAASHLPVGSRITADRIPANLLASQARMWPVYHPANGFDPAEIYFAKTWQPSLDAVIQHLDIQYIYVDARIATSLPHEGGFYIFPGETAKPTKISRAAIMKFKNVKGLATVYHHGPVTIYDTAGIGGVAATRDGFVGNRPIGPSAPVQVVSGAVLVVLMVLLLRTRWPRIARAMSDVGILGSGLTALAVLIFLAGLLFWLRWMPGPAFTLGAAEMALALAVVRGRAVRRSMAAGLRIAAAFDPLVLLGLLALAAGVALDLHSAWSVDVTSVNRILGTIAGHQ